MSVSVVGALIGVVVVLVINSIRDHIRLDSLETRLGSLDSGFDELDSRFQDLDRFVRGILGE